MKTFLPHLIQIRLQRLAKSALALTPRGAIAHDVLRLEKLSIQKLHLEWRARDVHPWDRDLPSRNQAELFCQQALEDTEAALLRLFQMLPDVEQIDLKVFEPVAANRVILTGNVEREEFLSARRLPSLRMRLCMMGVRFLMVDGHLETPAA